MRIACQIPKITNTHSEYVRLLHCNSGCTKAPRGCVMRTLPVLFCWFVVFEHVHVKVECAYRSNATCRLQRLTTTQHPMHAPNRASTASTSYIPVVVIFMLVLLRNLKMYEFQVRYACCVFNNQ